MENEQQITGEKKNFFGTKTNGTLLLVLTMLMVIAIVIMLGDKQKYFPVREGAIEKVVQNNTQGDVQAKVAYPNLPDQSAPGFIGSGKECVSDGGDHDALFGKQFREAKEAFLKNSNISEQYFQKHFSVACNKVNMVGFEYRIGEFSTKIVDYIDSRGRFFYFSNVFKNLHEIENVISKEQALALMNQCIGESKSFEVLLGTNGLYMESSRRGSEGIVTGLINLETGSCTTQWLSDRE